MKKIYICVLSTVNYLNGILILNENLKYLKSKYKLICLINENISSESRKILDFFDVDYKVISGITYSNQNERMPQWINTFDKLNVFKLEEYDKIVYLDSDLLILENIDDLFEKDDLSMPRDLPYFYNNFNSGVMVLKPNKDDFEQMKKIVIRSNKKGRKISDQNIINEYFKDKIKPLPYGYNMVREIINEKVKYYNSILNKTREYNSVIPILKYSKDAKIIHYIGKLKPFMIDKVKDNFYDEYSYLYKFYLDRVLTKKHLYEVNNSIDLVSIIVPIYDKEELLDESLESIVKQSYQNIEIILINDGSTDDSPNICKEYSKNYTMVKLINQENMGINSARNRGLREAKGDYICFINGGDKIEKTMIEQMLFNLKKYNVDFVQCAIIYDEFEKIKYDSKEEIFVSKEEILLDFLDGNISPKVCAKMYKKELIKDIYFDEKYKNNEDYFFIFEVIKKATSFMKIGIYLYNLVSEKNKFLLEENYKVFTYLDNVKEYILQEYKQYNNEYNFFVYMTLRRILEQVSQIEEVSDNDKFMKELINRFNELNEKV